MGVIVTNTLIIPPNPLFDGMTEEERETLLVCLKARVKHYGKGETLLWESENIEWVGIVLSGMVEASKLDISGKRLVISRLGCGKLIGDILSLHPERQSPATVTALESVTVLSIPAVKLLEPCQKQCESHNKLIRNLLISVSEKYFEIQDRILYLTRPTIRDKLVTYLKRASEDTALARGSRIFAIPYDRAALAEYLNVERSALSRELSAMKRDGLIDYHKNNFRLL